MDGFEPSYDDVVMMDTSQSLISNDPTFRVNQLQHILKERFKNIFNTGSLVLDEGVDCQFLDAQAGGGWKKAKIRLRVEIVLDEPEPEPEPISTDPNSLDSLRAELHSKQ
jgi:hypothetical protein